MATDEAESADAAVANDDATAMEMFNNDVRLRALKAVADTLAPIDQKKAVLYFSAGLQRSGEDNQVELRAAINAAVRAHVSIYPVDARGLQAIVPGGDATQASGRGTQLFSGAGVAKQLLGFECVAGHADVACIGHRRPRVPRHERFRRSVRPRAARHVGVLPARLREHQPREGRTVPPHPGQGSQAGTPRRGAGGLLRGSRLCAHEQDGPRGAAPGAVAVRRLGHRSAGDGCAGYFRLAADRYYVPLAVVVPGSAVPLPPDKDKDKLALDVLGLVTDEQGRPVGRIRQTLQLPPGSVGSLGVASDSVSVGRDAAAGTFLVEGRRAREHERPAGLVRGAGDRTRAEAGAVQGQLGRRSARRCRPAPSKSSENPLVHDGEQLVPNVTHVVGRDQKMFFFYEVYDPATAASTTPDVRTSLAFYEGRSRCSRRRWSSGERLDDPSRHAAVFRLEVPAATFTPASTPAR